ncbi:phosphate acyltransferase PlsX [Tepidimicrobium xylanilyticum]|uniref:Phosphate acyltransferase n=1 Tax=Tepidimicrobium xylanilyticum TaxID=1123352 RepID=A0A1H2YQ55_9FIRM|nr:phosphate acyltransferase PlsX [Tepidimicrobium xylanilyticum]GMG97171.1 phosphate acyltransferase [Tepidimicrobium xylanilyticum]SDX06784.1 phosphate:acyl-[acyl carrier protein] acyltransferase [Tepidimicrobium xylanilyticum]
MKVIVDGMGGDNSPEAIVEGCVSAVKELGVSVIIVGNKEIIDTELSKYDFPDEAIDIINSTEIITNDDEPAFAIRRKKDSSMVIGLKALKEGIGDGFVSAGSTGALLAGGLFIVSRIDGIERAALASVYPTIRGISLLLDLGANVDCKPEYLKQFAIMGSIYSEKVLKVEAPRVGLVNIGTERGKGNQLVQKAYELIENSNLNFIGNVEARDIPAGVADVLVCDGFVGNIILKLTEGMAKSLFSSLKEEFNKTFQSKVGAILLRKQLMNFKGMLDYREYGGAPLLGLKKPVVKAHGSSDAFAIKNAIRQVKDFIEMDVINIIEDDINASRNK